MNLLENFYNFIQRCKEVDRYLHYNIERDAGIVNETFCKKQTNENASCNEWQNKGFESRLIDRNVGQMASFIFQWLLESNNFQF